MPQSQHPNKASDEAIRAPKKTNSQVRDLRFSTKQNVRLMFQVEAGFVVMGPLGTSPNRLKYRIISYCFIFHR